QHGASGGRQSSGAVRCFASVNGLRVIAAGVKRVHVIGGGRRRGYRRQHQQCQHSCFHFKNSPFKADRIMVAVLAVPNSAAKEPKRGPCVWPSSTSYSAPNQARSGSKPCALPTS